MYVKWIPVLLLLEQLSFHFSPGRCGKVLVWPTEYSHWMNMKIILDELVQRGHEVIVLASTASILVDPNEPSALQFEIFSTSFTKDDMKFFYRKTISKWTNDISKDTFWTYYSRVQEMLWEGYDILAKLCRDIVFNRRLMTKLQQAKFDVLLADAVGPCGELLAELLQVPLVYSVRFSPGYKTERYSGGLPFLPSYVPVIFSELSDQMTFKERVKNMLYALYFDFWFQTFNQKKWDRFYTDALDAVGPCGELLAELLQVPLVYSLRVSPGYVVEKRSGGLPFPPSYVPIVFSELSDQMTFMERLKNMVHVLYFDFCFQMFNENWDQFYSEVLGRPTTVSELMGKAEIWLIRNYWDFEFPRPFLPHFVFIGGHHCKPAKPLPKEMEQFAQSSGEDGIVVFTLGSMVTNLTEETANTIASALAQIPQKVIWRYEGKKPDTLGPNTRLYKWIPQNDLLGHPKTKAFITHGGANGVYEAIYHGIPMVGIPLFADQPDNIVRMKTKGAAVRLDIDTMSSADLLNALRTVINDPSYKENAMKLSRIHHEQPVKPLDRAVFWIEFVMRHKGAKHLRPASYDLNWFQYHSLDVIGFLLACVATAVLVVIKCCLFCCRKFAKTGKKGKRD